MPLAAAIGYHIVRGATTAPTLGMRSMRQSKSKRAGMRRAATAWAATIGLAALAGTGIAAGAPKGAAYAPLFEQVWSTVERNFYDPGFHGADWAAVGRRYRGRLGDVGDDAAFQALIGQMLGELKVSHVALSAPAGSAARARGIGARFGTVEGAATAVEVSPLSDAWRQGLRPGDRLLSPADAVAGALGSRAELTVQHCAGQTRALQVARVGLSAAEHPGWRWSRYSPRKGLSLGYLRVDRFDDGAAALADSAMSELGDTQGLILDLRRNSGGNTSALRLASYFMQPGERPVFALYARSYLQSLGRRPSAADIAQGPKTFGAYTDAAVFEAIGAQRGAAVFHSDPLSGKPRYRAPVVVLIDGETASAGEGFAWAMRLYSGARLFGRDSAGELLSGENFELTGGWTLTVPVHGLWAADGRDLGDRPLTPDRRIEWTRADLCGGRDPDLDAAIEALSAGGEKTAEGNE